MPPHTRRALKLREQGSLPTEVYSVRRVELLTQSLKITSFKRLGWKGNSCEGQRGEGTNQDAVETEGGISRQKEQGAVVTAAESLGKTGLPTSPEILLCKGLGKEPIELHTGTLLTPSVMGTWKIIDPEPGRKIYGFMGPDIYSAQILLS